MTVCPKCKFYNICKGRLNETVENCVRFKSVKQTNFDWLTETPERLASWIEYVLIESGCEVTQCRETWIMWLKEKHDECKRDVPTDA